MTGKKKTFPRKLFKILLITFSSLLTVVVLAFVGLRLIAPTVVRSNHKIETPGIDRMEMTEIGGIQQALYFRGQNTDNPVILFVHGGPGNSMMPFLQLFQYEWEDDFTVVHWDQRNVGKTYLANDPETVLSTMSVEQSLEDLHEVTEYVKQTMNKDQIILMGHSWGTVLGSMAVQKYPEDYSAYIGVAQAVNMAEAERMGYEKTIELAKAADDREAIDALEAVAPYPPTQFDSSSFEDMITVRTYQSVYGISMDMDFGSIVSIMATPYYSLKELRNSSILMDPLDQVYWQEPLIRFLMEEADVSTYGTDYHVPVYYIMGEDDYTCPYLPAKEFFDEITAPDKEIYTIPDASHMSFLDNKAEFNRVLLEEILPKIK